MPEEPVIVNHLDASVMARYGRQVASLIERLKGLPVKSVELRLVQRSSEDEMGDSIRVRVYSSEWNDWLIQLVDTGIFDFPAGEAILGEYIFELDEALKRGPGKRR